jgi:hypothetical protein
MLREVAGNRPPGAGPPSDEPDGGLARRPRRPLRNVDRLRGVTLRDGGAFTPLSSPKPPGDRRAPAAYLPHPGVAGGWGGLHRSTEVATPPEQSWSVSRPAHDNGRGDAKGRHSRPLLRARRSAGQRVPSLVAPRRMRPLSSIRENEPSLGSSSSISRCCTPTIRSRLDGTAATHEGLSGIRAKFVGDSCRVCQGRCRARGRGLVKPRLMIRA